jgi:hypothetical protein
MSGNFERGVRPARRVRGLASETNGAAEREAAPCSRMSVVTT